jgi:hypothetical protein
MFDFVNSNRICFVVDNRKELLRKIGLWKVELADLVAEKAIADLRVLVSGHTRMALGNTRMSWLVRVWRRPYAYGRKR